MNQLDRIEQKLDALIVLLTPQQKRNYTKVTPDDAYAEAIEAWLLKNTKAGMISMVEITESCGFTTDRSNVMRISAALQLMGYAPAKSGSVRGFRFYPKR